MLKSFAAITMNIQKGIICLIDKQNNTVKSISLSAKGSRTMPYLVTKLNLRAKCPSNTSVKPAIKNIIAP